MVARILGPLVAIAILAGDSPSNSDYREMRREFLGGLQGVHVAAFSTQAAGPEADGAALARAVSAELGSAGIAVLTPEEAAGKVGFPMLSVVLEGLERSDGLFVGQLSLRLNEPATLLRTGQRVSAETWAEGLTLAVKREEVRRIVEDEVRRLAKELATDFRGANATRSRAL